MGMPQMIDCLNIRQAWLHACTAVIHLKNTSSRRFGSSLLWMLWSFKIPTCGRHPSQRCQPPAPHLLPKIWQVQSTVPSPPSTTTRSSCCVTVSGIKSLSDTWLPLLLPPPPSAVLRCCCWLISTSGCHVLIMAPQALPAPMAAAAAAAADAGGMPGTPSPLVLVVPPPPLLPVPPPAEVGPGQLLLGSKLPGTALGACCAVLTSMPLRLPLLPLCCRVLLEAVVAAAALPPLPLPLPPLASCCCCC